MVLCITENTKAYFATPNIQDFKQDARNPHT